MFSSMSVCHVDPYGMHSKYRGFISIIAKFFFIIQQLNLCYTNCLLNTNYMLILVYSAAQ